MARLRIELSYAKLGISGALLAAAVVCSVFVVGSGLSASPPPSVVTGVVSSLPTAQHPSRQRSLKRGWSSAQ